MTWVVKKLVKKIFLAIFVNKPIKLLGKNFRTKKTDLKDLFSSRSYKSLKLEFVCSQIPQL